MDEKQIAFILCVNNEQEFLETCYYLKRLHIPTGYTVTIIPVRNASSMTSGYLSAMKDSNAKYKVYLHQDTFILNTDFISDLLQIFQSNASIGMIGCIGRDKSLQTIHDIALWNTGAVCHNLNIPNTLQFSSDSSDPAEVEVLDGLLLATQYDIPWRSDLFLGWDCYDMSQCFEMKRAGFKIVVPHQKKPWCYHDNFYSKFIHYYDDCNKLALEYQDIHPFILYEYTESEKNYYLLQETIRKKLSLMINGGLKQELIHFIENTNDKGYLYLRDYELFACIDQQERLASATRFWLENDSFESLTYKLNHLRHLMRRIEYGTCEGSEISSIINNYSIQAVYVMSNYYPSENAFVWKLLRKAYQNFC